VKRAIKPAVLLPGMNLEATKRLEIVSGDNRIVVDRKHVAHYVPPVGLKIRARYRNGFVYLIIGDKTIEMTTPVAVKVGLALCNNGGECFISGDVVRFAVNREEWNFLPSVAVQLGGVIAKKADRADDWQRAIAG